MSMKLSVHSGSPLSKKVDLLVIGVPAEGPADADSGKGASRKSAKSGAKSKKKAAKGPKPPASLVELDKSLGGALWASAVEEGFEGKPGQTFHMRTLGKASAKAVLLVGLGPSDELGLDAYRRLGGTATRAAGKATHKAAMWLWADDAHTPAAIVEAAAEGLLLAAYRFDRYLTDDEGASSLSEVQIFTESLRPEAGKAALAHAGAVSSGVSLARDLVNECPMALNPVQFAEEAKKVGKTCGLQVQVFTEKELAREKMGLMLGVAQGASPYVPPRMVRLSYKPKKKARKHVALVGKGVTFDSGGLDIKPAAGMLDMKIDMSGAAAVLGTMRAIGELKPDIQVTAYLGCVENGIGGNAYHPGDVLRSRKGISVEVNNTDAEGRLVLADCIDYCLTQDEPDVLIDLATLTGACMVALGPTTAGLFSTDDELAEDIRNEGRRAGEDFWRLPLNQDLAGQLKSNIADTKNTGERWGGAITAALFLQKFVDGRATWAHLDIAGPASMEKDHPYIPRGGAGFAVRTLSNLIAR